MGSRLAGISRHLARFERALCCTILVLLVLLILLNVLTRAFDVAVYWLDELAICLMVWLALVGSSLLVHERRHAAVTLVSGVLSRRLRTIVQRIADTVVLGFALSLLAMCFAWYDPLTFRSYGFNAEEYAAQTYNFIYQEPTTTLEIKKAWLWLAVPLVSVTMAVHALAKLLQGEEPETTR